MTQETPSIRPNEARAEYTRRYLKSKKIDIKELSRIATDMGSPLSEKEYNQDDTLVGWVKGLQKKIGFAEEDNAKGQDGMLGPKTLREIKKYIAKNKKGEERAVVAAEIRPVTKPEAPIEHKGYNGQPETPLSKLTEILSGYEGKTWAGRLSGNGGRPVAFYVPKGFDPSKPVEIAYHFHGTHGQIIDIPRPPLEGAGKIYRKVKVGTISDAHNRIDQALGKFQKEGSTRNAILVYPLSAGQRSLKKDGAAWRQAYDAEWMKSGNDTGDDMAKFHQESMSQLASMGIKVNQPSVTLSGHSAGGIVLKNILAGGFSADKVKFLDASYGHWATAAYRDGMRINPNMKFEVYVRRGSDKTDSDITKNIEKSKNVSYVRSSVAHEVFNQNFI